MVPTVFSSTTINEIAVVAGQKLEPDSLIFEPYMAKCIGVGVEHHDATIQFPVGHIGVCLVVTGMVIPAMKFIGIDLPALYSDQADPDMAKRRTAIPKRIVRAVIVYYPYAYPV